MRVLWIFVLCFVLNTYGVFSFNLDTKSFVRFRRHDDSMFGFTVAEHIERGKAWILVGAPEAQTRQPNVTRGGLVYRCDVTRDDACYEIPFDPYGNKLDNITNRVLDIKSGQWLGASLTSTGRDGPVVACAPRYVTTGYTKAQLREPVGTCFVARNDFTDIVEYAPCRTRNLGIQNQGHCEAGLGLAVSKDGRRLYVGAPGSWYWQGQVYSLDTSFRMTTFMPTHYMDYGQAAGQVHSQDLFSRPPAVLSTPESNKIYDNSYLGYSVAVGDFSGQDQQGVAVGMPRGADLLGRVVLYTWDLVNYHNITGEQLGSYFSYSICSGDIDGDGLDDLIVGAPFYTIPNNEEHYENGRVYVIYQGRAKAKFQAFDFLDGENSKARFGLSVTSLGDINLDGFGDFAVGAPYGGLKGSGAVYIYHGGQEGVGAKPSQIILAEDLAQTNLNTFGFSVSGGVDLDDNKYTDLVVGAYNTSTVIFFKARPVVKMTASILFGSKLISLEDPNCSLLNGVKVTCTAIEYCLKYDGINVDSTIEFKLRFFLDSKKQRNPRMFFTKFEERSTHNETITLNREQIYCNRLDVYIAPEVRDKLTPLEVEMKYDLIDNRGAYYTARDPNAVLMPILDQNAGNSKKDSINIQKNCGPDNNCIPDLQLVATSNVDRYLVGSKERLSIDVLVQNFGQDSFESTYSLKIPPGIDYVKVERIGTGPADVPVQCSPPAAGNNETLKCDIGNPLPKGKLVNFKVLLEPFHVEGMANKYEFTMEANSTNPELNGSLADNVRKISIGLWAETDLTLTGTSIPPDLHYNTTQYKSGNYTHEGDIGPQVHHVYSIRNNGPSTIEKADIYIVWPYQTLSGDDLMYLLAQPETTENIQCEPAQHVNDMQVIIDHRVNSYLQTSGLALAQGGGNFAGKNENIQVSSNFSHSYTSQGSAGGGHVTHSEESSRNYNIQSGDASLLAQQRAQEAHRNKGNQAQGGGLTGSTGSSQASSNGQHFRWSETSSHSENQEGFRNQGGKNSQGNYANQRNYGVQNQGNFRQQGHGPNQGSSLGGADQGASSQGGYYQGGSSQGGSSQEGSAQGGSHQGGSYQGGSSQEGYYGGASSQGGSYQGGSSQGESYQGRSSQGRSYQGGSTQGGSSQGGSSQGAPSQGGSYKYTTSWNTNQQGGRAPVIHRTVINETTYIDENGVAHKSESSTEYYLTGHEGEAGSSYSNRLAGERKYQQGYEESGVHQSGNRNYGAASQSQTGTFRQTGGSMNQQSNGSAGKKLSYNASYAIDSGSEYDGPRHSWSTEETVNQDLAHAKSQTFAQSQYGQGGKGYQGSYATEAEYAAGNTYLGAPQTPTGMGTVALGGNNELRTNILNLGVLPSGNNAEQELRHSAGGASVQTDHQGSGSYRGYQQGQAAGSRVSNQGSSYSGHQSQTSGSRAMAQGSGSHAGQAGYGISSHAVARGGEFSSSQQQGGYDTSYSRQYSNSGSYNSEQGGSSQNAQYGTGMFPGETIGHDNVDTERPVVAATHFRWDRNTRYRRQADEVPSDFPHDSSQQELNDAIQCQNVKCVMMKCHTGVLATDQEMWIALRARMNANTLNKLTADKSIQLSSFIVARIAKLPFIGEPAERPLRQLEAITVVTPQQPPAESAPIPLWVVVLAACAGAALLLLLIALLYKCGFFKRNRPTDAPERQPLNRNGHYGHADEQL